MARTPSGRWFVDAGPFVIQVTGTQFDVDWSSYDDTRGTPVTLTRSERSRFLR